MYLGLKQTAVKIYYDNQRAVKLVHNPEFHQRTKHIDLSSIEKLMSTEMQPGRLLKAIHSFLAKAIHSPKFLHCRDAINCKHVQIPA
ncbi:hypothetical protein B4U80_08767 [Leptotrombidium deliense]|uniref:Copia protein-like protein n=1 Tax=Leptotrombidium deliense TaxID=299467 RepID=A0A443S374_9ACAR|nr:hypothetical protein B4U80_08767 [Leptotrombidium deliense]